MPLWRIFAHPSTFDSTQRSALAKSVTELYVARGLPAFYVNVIVSPAPAQRLLGSSGFWSLSIWMAKLRVPVI
jgi:Putative oxalocrotonate tautomerase enzyme